MFNRARFLFLIVETYLMRDYLLPVEAVIDGPILLKDYLPNIKPSPVLGVTLKGIIRAAVEKGSNEIDLDGTEYKKFARDVVSCLLIKNALTFTDARLLLLPVKSVNGVSGWVTCTTLLESFIKDLNMTEVQPIPKLPCANTVPSGCKLVSEENKVILEVPSGLKLEHFINDVIFEELIFQIKEDEGCSKFAIWISDILDFKKMGSNIVVLNDMNFSYILTNSTKEYFPSDTILYSLILTSPVFVGKDQDKNMLIQENRKNNEEILMEYFVNGLPAFIPFGENSKTGKSIVKTKIV